MSENILIVDDEESLRFTFREFLSEVGYNVVTAGSFEDAIKEISKVQPDLVFADIVLGGKTGIDLLGEIRKRKINCPVVMITGVPSIDTAAEAVRLGAFDYIPKPVNDKVLLRVAEKALEHKRLIKERDNYRANMDAMFQSVDEAIIIIGSDKTIKDMNPMVDEICGAGRWKVGDNYESVERSCSGQCISVISKALKDNKYHGIKRFQCKNVNGKELTLSSISSPLKDRLENSLGAILVLRDESRIDTLERKLKERQGFHNIIGHSPVMQELYALIEELAKVDTTVLISGESGTGKELIADALHFAGNRAHNPFVKVNCAALPETLLESELFGHVKGAFTGAVTDKMGHFERAQGGTILLDEIGDISPALQVRLLRVIEEKAFERVGGTRTINLDVRVVTATNQDLQEKVQKGEFRSDLLYRLHVVKIPVPALRQRRQDIPILVQHFIEKYNDKFKKDILSVSRDAMDVLLSYPWPGNVRQLDNAIEHAFVKCSNARIDLKDLPEEIINEARPNGQPNGQKQKDEIVKALVSAGGNKAKAARLLGISRKTLYQKIKKFDL